MEYYTVLKSIHLLGVVIFLGNIIVTAVWKVMADRTRDPAVVSYAQRLVTITDIAFTAVGVVLIYTTGQLMAPAFGGVFETYWIATGWWLFILSGVIWVLILIPIQIYQARLARGFASGKPIPQRYWMLSRSWNLAGAVATLLPLANLYFMVFKPV
ncbi:MAG: DUF2269 family protein [Pseudomonadota bacterium]|nr:hypothetical protein [Pseudomonadales bacterium]MDY6921039.1 DUF2269 family protein [Pseudomonadota bacterium]